MDRIFKISKVLVFFLLVLQLIGEENVKKVGKDIEITAAYQVRSITEKSYWEEGNKEINLVKQKYPDLPTMVYIYVKNKDKNPISIKKIIWGGFDNESHLADHSLIWWRFFPELLPNGMEGELSLCLRNALKEPTEFKIQFSNDIELTCLILPDEPLFRIQTIGFDESLSKVFLYVESSSFSSPLPQKVYFDGEDITKKCLWLSNEYVKNLRVCVISLKTPLKKGSIHTFRVISNNGEVFCASTLRAFNNISVFGTYGRVNFERYAKNGLSAYNSFSLLSVEQIEKADLFGIRCAMIVGDNDPPSDTIGHPSVYGYVIKDEPDCSDYRNKDVPMHLRLGSLAPLMVKCALNYFEKDTLTPSMLTVDLTFTPGNYFVYGPIPDILNPDIYPISAGWPLTKILKHGYTIKRATAPKPFTITYQGCWEECANPEIVRGFGRTIFPAEIKREMLYALITGAKGLFSYMDSTERGSLITHGTDTLPENWKEIGEMSRTLTMVAPLIEISHPFEWARPGGANNSVLTGTLICGENAAIIIVVNENYITSTSFSQKPAKNVKIVFPELPWLKPNTLVEVKDRKFIPIKFDKGVKEISWSEEEIEDGKIYLLTNNNQLLNALEANANKFFDRQKKALEKKEEERKRIEELSKKKIANGSFENFTGKADDNKVDSFKWWSIGNFLEAEAVSDSINGKYAIKLKQVGDTQWIDNPGLKAISQVISPDNSYAGKTLTLSFYVKGENIDSDGAVVFYDGIKGFWSDMKKTFPISQEWQKITFNVRISENSKKLQISFFPNIVRNSTNIVYFDNIELIDETKNKEYQKYQELHQYLIEGNNILGTYKIKDPNLWYWDTEKQEYNAVEWYLDKQPFEGKKYGLTWTFTIPEKNGDEYNFVVNFRDDGRGSKLNLLDEEGNLIKSISVKELDTIKFDAYQIGKWGIKFPKKPGTYTIEFVQDSTTVNGYFFGRVSMKAYLIPIK